MDSKFISGDARSSIESRRQSRTRSRYFRQCCTDIEFLPAVGRTTDRYVQGQFFIFLKEMHFALLSPNLKLNDFEIDPIYREAMEADDPMDILRYRPIVRYTTCCTPSTN